MLWSVETVGPIVDDEIAALPTPVRARLLRLMETVERIGLESLHEPHVKHIDGKLWEMRAKAPQGIARAFYVAVSGRRVIVLRVFAKKTQRTPAREIAIARERLQQVIQ